MGWSGGKTLNHAGHCHTAHMHPQGEHSSKGVISNTAAGGGCLCWDLDGSCGCQSRDTPDCLLGGEGRREHRVLLWYRACEQNHNPNQLHWGAGEWYFKRCQAGRKSSRCFFHAWKKTGKLFGEMVRNGRNSQRERDVWRENRAQGGISEPRATINLWAISRVAQPGCCLLFWKGIFLFLFLKSFQNFGGTELISEGTQPVAPSCKGHRKGPACVFLFLLLHLSYTSQSVA